MDVRRFGWMVVLLGAILACVAAFYALLPYLNRWDHFAVTVEATKAGYATSKYLDMKAELSQAQERLFLFGWGSVIALFLGGALIFSGKRSSPAPTKWNGDPPRGRDKTYWVCAKCNETTETEKNTCWNCGAHKV